MPNWLSINKNDHDFLLDHFLKCSADCNSNYINEYGDYDQANCSCYFPCTETVYSASGQTADWPTGSFFWDADCSASEFSDAAQQECVEQYRCVEFQWSFLAHHCVTVTKKSL